MRMRRRPLGNAALAPGSVGRWDARPRARSWHWLGVLFAIISILTGCAHAQRPGGGVPTMPSDEVSRRVERLQSRIERHPEDSRAQRDLGHLLWLHAGATNEALPHLQLAAAAGDVVSQSSLVIIGRARLDHPMARENSLRILDAAGEDSAWSRQTEGHKVAVTEMALRDLLAHIGERPSLDRELLRRLDPESLALHSPTLGVLASIAAARIQVNAGLDPGASYAARGCVQQWQMSHLLGRLGAADLPALSPLTPLEPRDPAHVLVAHRCSVRVWNAASTGGVRRLRAVVSNAAPDLYFEVVASDEYRLYVDGKLVARNDYTDRWPANDAHRWLRLPAGDHIVELHIAVPGINSTAMLNMFDGRGVPVTVAPVDFVPLDAVDSAAEFSVELEPAMVLGGGYDPAIYGPWIALLRLSRALGEGDYDRAEITVESLKEARFAEAFVHRALFEQNEPSRGGAASSSRLQGALEAALKLDPDVASARVQLMRMSLERDEVPELLAMVDALPDDVRRLYEVEVLLTGLYLQRDSDVQAAQAVSRAKRLAPDSCWVRRVELTLARRRSQAHLEDELIEAYRPCDRGDARRAAWARRRGDHAAALKITERRLEYQGDNMDLLDRKALDLVALGDLAGAMAVRETQLRFNPLNVAVATSYVDLAYETGKTAAGDRVVAHLLANTPAQPGVLELAERIGGGTDPLLSHRADGLAAVRDYGPQQERYEGASDVLVLDRDVVWIHDDLSQRHLIHQIVSLHSKESLDKYGEMGVPEQGQLLTLRTIKPDGRVVEPEVVPAKSGVSLRDLEVGDFVELEYIISRAPSVLLPGHIDLGGFRFRSTATPFHRSELIVNMPAALPYQVERRNDPPVATSSTIGDRTELRFLAEEMMRRTPEPDARSLSDEMPMVRVFTELDILEWRRITEANLRLTLRRNEELRSLVAEVTKDARDDEEITRAVWSWVLDNIESGGSMTTAITQTLAERSGNPLMLMMGMLNEAGVKTELWLGKSQFATPMREGDYPPVEDYAAPLLVVWTQTDAPPVALAPGSKVVPFGYHPMTLAREAIRLRPGDPLGPDALYGEVPDVPEGLADRRAYDLNLRLNREGEGLLTGTIELAGAEAIQWRRALTMFDRDRLLEVFQQAELQRVIPGATLSLESVEIEGEDENEQPLVFRFVANARGVGRQGADTLDLRASVVPQNAALQYARLPERWSELAVTYAAPVFSRVRIEVEGGTLARVPGEDSIDGEFGHYRRTITDGGAGASFITQEWSTGLILRGIPAEDYPAFLNFARAVDEVERQELQFSF